MNNLNIFGIFENDTTDSNENFSRIANEEKYKNYIDTHIKNVIRAYEELKHNDWLNTVYNSDIIEAFEELENSGKIINHDASKYSDDEFFAYKVRFFPLTQEEKEEANLDLNWEPFALAWKHHYMTNDHHPEHWIEENGNIKDMPLSCIIEMICDWMSFVYIGKESAVDYWDKNKEEKIKVMSPYTIKQVERIIDILRKEE